MQEALREEIITKGIFFFWREAIASMVAVDTICSDVNSEMCIRDRYKYLLCAWFVPNIISCFVEDEYHSVLYGWLNKVDLSFLDDGLPFSMQFEDI